METGDIVPNSHELYFKFTLGHYRLYFLNEITLFNLIHFPIIIPDILDPVLQPDPNLMNRSFWRQNTRIHFTQSAPPLYILDPVL
jgi:hypothetical protein